MASTIKKTILAASIALISFNAQATLTSYNPNGVDLVYSSVSNVTWTKDANLLGSMIASQGFTTVINNIIAASPTIDHTPGAYEVSASDFSNNGGVNWFGAMAFVNYLNASNYSGSSQWRLPTVIDSGQPGCEYVNGGTDCGWNSATNGTTHGYEMAELYYQELGSKAAWGVYDGYHADAGIVDPDNKFDNESRVGYWSGTEYAPSAYVNAWVFSTGDGFQDGTAKDVRMFAWAIHDGLVSPVPEPENLVMLLAGLGLLGVAVRRNK